MVPPEFFGEHERMNLRHRALAVALGSAVLVSTAACSSGPDVCDAAAQLRAAQDATGDQTTEQAATSWTETGESMESVEPPAEIADDWAVVTTTVVQVGEHLTSGTDLEKASETPKLLLADDFQAARDAVQDYAATTCDG